MTIILVTRVIKSQLAEPLPLGLVILFFFFFFKPWLFFPAKGKEQTSLSSTRCSMTGGCSKYHQHKMHMLDTTSAFLCIKIICPYLLEMEVIFGILFPHKEFMNSWLVFIKRCFSLPCIYIKKKKKQEVVKPGGPGYIRLNTQKQKNDLFSMDNTFHFRLVAWIHYVDWTELLYNTTAC